MLVIITATISSLSYAEAKETNYTFSCKGMHGGLNDTSVIRVKINKPFFGSPKANVKFMNKEHRNLFKDANVLNFDDAFVYFTDGWGYLDTEKFEQCSVTHRRRCLFANTIILAADKSEGEFKHEFQQTYFDNCCSDGVEYDGGARVNFSGTYCTRLVE